MNKRDDSRYITVLNHVRDQLDKPPKHSDILSIKYALYEHITSKGIDLFTYVVTTQTLADMLGEVMLINNDWLTLEIDLLNTKRTFFRSWFDIVHNAFKSPKKLQNDVDEYIDEKQMCQEQPVVDYPQTEAEDT